MSDTPRTDGALQHQGHGYNDVVIRCENVIAVARELERENAMLRKEIEGWKRYKANIDEALNTRDGRYQP
jgi:hypothetical protein